MANVAAVVVLVSLSCVPMYIFAAAGVADNAEVGVGGLRFDKKREFRILQIADMHYGDGNTTPCENV